MNKKKITLIFVFLFCFHNFIIPQDDFIMQRFFKSSNTCLNEDKDPEEMGCNFVRIIYPQFKESKYSNKLNKAILAMITSTFWEGIYTNDNSFDEYTTQFFTEYEKSKYKYFSPMDWFHSIEIYVENNNEKLTSLHLGSYYYLGGAHGCIRTITLNYDKINNKVLDLDDFFNPFYEPELNLILNQLANEELIKNEKSVLDKELDFFDASNYYYNDINKRFIIKQNSIIFYFDHYDSFRLLLKLNLEIPYYLLNSILNNKYIK